MSKNLNLKVGQLVMAARPLDTDGAHVKRGLRGIVFKEADTSGPMVRWTNGGTCSVYPGDIVLLQSEVMLEV